MMHDALIDKDTKQENCIARWYCTSLMSLIANDVNLSDDNDSRDTKRFYDMNKRNE